MTDPFATGAELREFMGDGAPPDSRADSMVAYTSAVIRRHTGQVLSPVPGDVVIYGRSPQALLVLPEKPVTAVTEVLVDALALTGGTDFDWDRWGGLYRLPPRSWWSWADHVQITYDHGWPAGSEELTAVKTICLEAAARAISMNKRPEFDQVGGGASEASGFAPEAILYKTERDLLDGLGSVAVG